MLDRRSLLIASAFLAVTLPVALAFPQADDEGYLTFIGARVLWDAPLPGLFFQKIHPLTSALHAPVATLGWTAFRVAHVVVAAAAVLLMGDAVERLGGRGWLAAMLVATSPVFILSAASGQSNTDGVFFLAATLNLHSRGPRAVIAGAALAGAALWSRYELALPLGAIVLWGLRDRAHRLPRMAAAAAFPAIYVLAGAWYHGDPLWLVRFPPSVTAPVPHNPVYDFLDLDVRGLGTWLSHVTLAVPAWPLLVLSRWRTLPGIARVLLVVLALQAAAMIVLPLLRMFFEGLGPRYMLVLSPLVAGILAMTPRVARSKLGPRLAVGLCGLVTIGAPLVPGDALHRAWARVPSEVTSLARRLRAQDAQGTVYTNSQQLAILLAWAPEELDVRFVPHHDVLFELHRLTNHTNGQYARIMDAMERHLYGGATWPCAIGPLTEADRFVLTEDARADVLFPTAYWEQLTVAEERGRRLTVRRPLPTTRSLPTPVLPEGFPASVITDVCDR